MGGLAGNPRDGAGESLWYAVSGNLLRFNLGTYFGGVAAETDPAVNWFDPFVSPPDTTDAPDVDDPPFDWLTVCDASGAVLSSRVAFVVIAPGAPVYRGDLGTGRLQSRAGAAPNPNEYLDRIVIAGATCDTDNANADGQFVMAADAELASTAGAAVDGFNDRLVYVTVDELLPLLARRVMREVGDAVQQYAADHGGVYPWPAPFGDPDEPTGPALLTYLKSYDAGNASPYFQADDRFGWLPVHRPHLDDRTTQETFETPFRLEWRMLNGGTVSPANATVTDAVQRTNSVFFDDGVCVWRHAGYVQCSASAVTENVPKDAPWNPGGPNVAAGADTCSASMHQCRRTVTLLGNVVFDGTLFATDAPDATRPRTRTAREDFSGADVTMSVQIDHEECATADPTSCTAAGTGTVTAVSSTDLTDFVWVSGLRYDIGVVPDAFVAQANDTDLPEWYVTGGWHRMFALAVSSGYAPGAGGSCTPGTDCLELETVDQMGTADGTPDRADVGALLLFTGRVLFGGTGQAANTTARYFEGDAGASGYGNDDVDDDYVTPESLPTLRTLVDADLFNDQALVLAP